MVSRNQWFRLKEKLLKISHKENHSRQRNLELFQFKQICSQHYIDTANFIGLFCATRVGLVHGILMLSILAYKVGLLFAAISIEQEFFA